MIKPGVLILKGNRIFGRKGKKLLYQAVSVDGEKYIIPYQPKPNFETFGENMYILLDTEKHVCVENFGKVSNLDSYQKYRLHCLKLVYSLKKFPKNLLWNSSSNIEFENEFIFTIDPIGCKDFDDAISINDEYITIYISNVPVILEQLQLWDYMTEQTSTIYFPTSNIPMLPKQISENICSLVANHEKKWYFTCPYHVRTIWNKNLVWILLVFQKILIMTRPNYKNQMNTKVYSNLQNNLT